MSLVAVKYLALCRVVSDKAILQTQALCQFSSRYIVRLAATLPATEAYKLFENHILKHSVQRPPFSIGVFSLTELKLLVEFVVEG